MYQVQEDLGAACTVRDFEDSDLTPQIYYYADNVEDGFEKGPDETLPPTQEVNGNYVGANVLLPYRNDIVQVRFRKHARDNNSNTIGRANKNRILYIREYVFELKDGREAELSANAIVQTMYVQCDPDGHTYVLFHSLVDIC